jgi:hypothetical protein
MARRSAAGSSPASSGWRKTAATGSRSPRATRPGPAPPTRGCSRVTGRGGAGGGGERGGVHVGVYQESAPREGWRTGGNSTPGVEAYLLPSEARDLAGERFEPFPQKVPRCARDEVPSVPPRPARPSPARPSVRHRPQVLPAQPVDPRGTAPLFSGSRRGVAHPPPAEAWIVKTVRPWRTRSSRGPAAPPRRDPERDLRPSHGAPPGSRRSGRGLALFVEAPAGRRGCRRSRIV